MILYLSKGRIIHLEKSKSKWKLITAQKVIIKAGWYPNGIPVESDMSPALLNVFDNNLNDGTKSKKCP